MLWKRCHGRVPSRVVVHGVRNCFQRQRFRRTRAFIAREKGLEPLATLLFRQKADPIPLDSFVNHEKQVTNIEEALEGARDIIAEWISEDASIRARLRELFLRQAVNLRQVCQHLILVSFTLPVILQHAQARFGLF